MKRHIHRVGLGAFGGLLAIAMGFTGTSGAQSLSIGGNPAYPKPDNPRSQNIFIIKLKPGETARDGIRISNPTEITRTINLGAVDSVAAIDGSFSCKQNSEKKTDVGSWITLDKKQVTLEPGKETVVDFTVTVPEKSSPGEHGGCVTFQDTKSYAKTSGAGIQLGFRGAVRLAVTLPGEIRKELTIVRVETKRNEDGSYTVSPVAKNGGNVSLDVQARVQLRSLFGQKSRILDDAKYPIMPGATTGWPYRFERPYWGGFYKAYTSLNYNADPKAGIGEHMGDTKKASRISKYFFIIPAPGAIAVYVAAIMLPLLIILWLIFRKRRATVLGKDWEQYTVQAGDSLVGLATAAGIRWKQLAKMNNIKPPYGLQIDQQILLPKQRALRPKRSKQASLQAVEASERSAVAGSGQVARMAKQAVLQEKTMLSPTKTPIDPRDIPWPSQEEEYRRWQAEHSGYYQASGPSRQPSFSNPYHGDEDPAKLAESWNGPSQEAVEHNGIVEDASGVPPMHWMWDDLVDEPKKLAKKAARKKITTKTSTKMGKVTKKTPSRKTGA